MKHKFKLKKKKNLISINMSIVIITMLMFAIDVGYSKFSTTLNIRGTIIGKKPETHEEDYIVENEDENTLVLNTDKVNPSNPVAVSDLLAMEFTGLNINPNQTFTITSEVNKLSNRQITINNQTLSVYLTD